MQFVGYVMMVYSPVSRVVYVEFHNDHSVIGPKLLLIYINELCNVSDTVKFICLQIQYQYK